MNHRYSVSIALLLFGFGLRAADAEWAITYGGRQRDDLESIRELPGGGYVAVGFSDSFSATTWVVNLKSNGRVKWQRGYSGHGHSIFGDYIQTASDGGFIVAGGDGEVQFTSGDGWLMKLNRKGKLVWQKRYGGSTLDSFFGLCEASGGGYVAAGGTYSFGAGLEDGWLVKVDVNGEVLWEKTYGGSSYDSFRSVHETAAGNYLVAGFTESFGAGERDAWLLLVDGGGDVLWQKTYGGTKDDQAFDAHETSDGGFVFVGRTDSFSAGKSDGWIAKLQESGALTWQRRGGGKGYDGFVNVQEVPGTGYVVAGYLEENSKLTWLLGLKNSGKKRWQYTYGTLGSLAQPFVQRTSNDGYVMSTRILAENGTNFEGAVFELDSEGKIGSQCAVIEKVKIKVKKGKGQTDDSVATAVDSAATVFSKPIKVKKTKASQVELCSTD